MSINQPSNHFLFLDLLKISAIILMIYNHVFLEWYRFTEPNLFYHTNNLTRMSSALFLFLTGLLLMQSFNRSTHHRDWFKQKALRALGLIGISLVLFLLDPTSNLKYFYSSGILQLIGVLYLLTFPLLLVKSKKVLLSVLVLICIFILFSTHLFRSAGIYLPFLNSYSFPLLPHSSYYLLGLLVSNLFPPTRKIRSTYWKLLTLCFIFTVLYLEAMIQPTALVLFDLVIVQSRYWQPTLFLVGLISCLILSLYLILRNIEHKIKALPKSHLIAILSKYSLEIYILHLLLILVLKTTLLPSTYSSTTVLGIFIGILFSGTGYLLLRTKFPLGSKKTNHS